MAESIYDDVNIVEAKKDGTEVDMVVNVYENKEAIKQHKTDTEWEDCNIKAEQQAQNTVIGINPAEHKCYRLATVCLVLLCVLLLNAVTVLWIRFSTLKKEKDQLQTNCSTLTTQRDQLQTNYSTLTTEKAQLQTSYNTLTIEKNQVQELNGELQGTVNNLVMAMKAGWVLYGSSIYYISTEQKSWTESMQDCKDRGADLVIINSPEEQAFLVQQSGGGWIGLNDMLMEGDWMWVDGTPVTTGFWWHGEPNNNGNEDCAVMGYQTDPVLNWADYSCEIQLIWVCEIQLDLSV